MGLLKKTYQLFLFILIIFACNSPLFASNKLHFQLHGINDELAQKIQTIVATQIDNSAADQSTHATDQSITTAPDFIRTTLETNGYFKATVTVASIKRDKESVNVDVNIIPGPALRFTSVRLQLNGDGKNNKNLNKLINDFPLKRNAIFTTEAYESAKELLFQTAMEQGYVKAKYVKNEVRIDRQKYTADVTLILDTDNPYYIGDVQYITDGFSKDFLARLIYFKPNARFSSHKIYGFQQSLNDSGYFGDVDAAPDFDHIENYHIPVHVTLTPPKSQRYDIGLGYGSFTGPRLSAGVNFRHIGDSGQHFNAELKLSSVSSGLAAKYYIPGNNPLTDQYILGALYQKFSPKNGRSYSENLSATYLKKLGHWQNSLTLNYLSESYSVEDMPTISSRLLYPSLTISYMKADDILNPQYGKSFNFNLQGSTNNLFSTTNFLQSTVKGKYLFSPTTSGRVILRGDIGYTLVNNLNSLPLTLRYFAGGINSIRGYSDSSIGPGKYLAVGSVEYQHKIIDNWYGALFYDIGSASDHYGKPAPSVGDGVGIVYQSIVGPIKVYVGRAENKPGKPMGFEFNVGPEF